MLFLFIVGVLVAVIGIFAAVVAQRASIAVAAIFIFLACWLGSSMGTVDTKNVGVVTSFKKPTGEVKEAGAYFKAPWKSVTDMSLAWQTQSYQYEVQAVGSAKIGLDVRPRWRMTPEAAPELFQNYKDFDGVVNNLFANELVDASNKLFQGYNPLTNVDVKTGQPIRTKEQFAAELKTELDKRFTATVDGKVIKLIELDRIAMPTIAPDKDTQDKINQQVAEFAKGKVLDQQLANAQKQADITAKNASVDKVTRCMEIAAGNGGEPGLCLNGGAGIILNKAK